MKLKRFKPMQRDKKGLLQNKCLKEVLYLDKSAEINGPNHKGTILKEIKQPAGVSTNALKKNAVSKLFEQSL